MTAVYVIAAEGGPVKVGMAVDPAKRLQTLRTGTPYRLHLAHVEEVGDLSASKIERATHALLNAARTHGEWFAVSVDDARHAIRQAVTTLRQAPPAKPTPVVGVGAAWIKAAQCRAARALVNWSAQQLATAAEVGVNTVTRFEAGSGTHTRTVEKLQRALEAAGVAFVPANGGGSGVRWKQEPGA